MATTVRIAMLNTDTPVPNVLAKRGSYGNIFQNLLAASAQRLSKASPDTAPISVQSQDFDVVEGEYPSSPADWDALLVTGSVASSYDDKPWIHRLDAYLSEVYRDFPSVRIFGSCFGHQIVCQSILREQGVFVEKDPNGWEIGVHEIQLEDIFSKALGGKKTSSTVNTSGLPPTPAVENDSQLQLSQTRKPLRMQLIHSDHVNVPKGSLPPTWSSIGRTASCAVQGVYEPRRVLTYQGHFEFDRFINSETVNVFGAKWEADKRQAALDRIDNDDDSEEAADMVLRFFLEGRDDAETGFGNGGLVTPPVEG